MLKLQNRLAQHRLYLRCLTFNWLVVAVLSYWLALPEQLFTDPGATLLLDRQGRLLGASIAADGQWRFEGKAEVPEKFAVCLIQFEDRGFYDHHGVSLRGLARAFKQNIQEGRIKSGGSTLTMQLVRMMRGNPSRTYHEKVVEIILATRLELRYTKKEILAMYAMHAPFGNNVVGLEAAAWRYYGREASGLSWSEAATLAVLPNAPGLIYPGKNHESLLRKRNRLLARLRETELLDALDYELALSEELPAKPLPLPRYAPHLLERLKKEGYQGKTTIATVDIHLQNQVAKVLEQHHYRLRENEIYNGAILVSSVKTGELLAYVGNVTGDSSGQALAVDCSMAPRSTGSILKPILYAKSLESGLITQEALLVDVPSHFGSFSPKNFNRQHDGAVPAKEALARSLNIPFVRLLNEYGHERFHQDLKSMGFSHLKKSARHYGLSLILGGAETSLWELNAVYLAMARELKGLPGKISWHNQENTLAEPRQLPDKTALFAMMNAMTDLNRPDEEGNWMLFEGSGKIAWKTGTSYGFRDAWCVGITPEYVVCVWIGNASGEGRPGLTGIRSAAPVMFDIFRLLPASRQWFVAPKGMKSVEICVHSGFRAHEHCPERKWQTSPSGSGSAPVCAYHRIILVNDRGQRIDADCANPFDRKEVVWFVLPPHVERYYRNHHPHYRSLPAYAPGCRQEGGELSLSVLYPRPNSKIYLPREFSGEKGKAIFEATHRQHGATLFWHLDDEYLGETRDIHQMALQPEPGKHILQLTDENGRYQTVHFEVLGTAREELASVSLR